MIINHNLSAIYAQRVLKFNNWEVDKNIEKLSSGQRINKAGDDASGLAVSEKMRTQIRGLRQAERNAEDGMSFIQAIEGYLAETHSLLQRVRELAVQSSNGIYTDEDRMQIQVEVSELIDEVDRIASQGQFNTMMVLTGRFADPAKGGFPTASMWFHVGANMDQREKVFVGTMNSQGLGLKSPIGNPETATFISISTPGKANAVIGVIDRALMKLSKQRADLGAYYNRLEHTAKGLMVGYENIQAAESRIRDADMAEVMVKFVKDQILIQAGTAMLAQANMKPQSVLKLLG
ncbi:MAG: flagellin [Spirochaetes bacterium]|nr:flagellin [Spirochaetota bacterium]